MDTQTQDPVAAHAAAHVGFLKQMESFFDTYLNKKAPFHLPPAAKEFIVKFGPWITLVLMLLAIPVILIGFGLTMMVSPMVYAAGAAWSGSAVLQSIIALAVLVIEAVALPGLFKRSLKAWYLVYYASLLSAFGSLLALNIISLIIGLVISMYFLFQIKEYYH